MALIVALIAGTYGLLAKNTRGAEIATVLALPATVTATIAAIVATVVALRPARSSSDVAVRKPDDPKLPDSPEVVITKFGGFAGGDAVAIELVTQQLALPAPDRSVRVHALPLEDREYQLRDPDRYVGLRDCVRNYELSLGRLLRGSIHYRWPWTPDLAEAVLELRSVELPARQDRESWYVWPPEAPGRAINVRLDETNVRILRTGAYGAGLPETVGMPLDEPIWLSSAPPVRQRSSGGEWFQPFWLTGAVSIPLRRTRLSST